MERVTGTLMLKNHPIAIIKNGLIIESNDTLLPLYVKRTRNVEKWIASRAIDSHRTNARLLKKVLRLPKKDDMHTALAVHAATLTDCYWFKPMNSNATYEDIRFKENHFDQLALRGDPDSFSLMPSRTPELTNTGSFEKCWRLIDGKWWMYKNENKKECFSELFIAKLGQKLGLDMAHYEMDGDYIRSKDFTNSSKINFEPISSLVDDNDDYEYCFNILNTISSKIAEQYLALIWMDTICYNIDRHTENFGLLRDVHTGEILSLAPNYANNIALIARGYPKDISRKNDQLIYLFYEFIKKNEEAQKMYQQMKLPEISLKMINDCLDEITIDVDRIFIQQFLLNGQTVIKQIIDGNE